MEFNKWIKKEDIYEDGYCFELGGYAYYTPSNVEPNAIIEFRMQNPVVEDKMNQFNEFVKDMVKQFDEDYQTGPSAILKGWTSVFGKINITPFEGCQHKGILYHVKKDKEDSNLSIFTAIPLCYCGDDDEDYDANGYEDFDEYLDCVYENTMEWYDNQAEPMVYFALDEG